MKLVYGIKDKPRFSQLIVFAFQQLLAIMAATIAVPMIISGHYDSVGDVSMSTAAALVGAGFGTLVYLLFTKFSSPVFLGSSFAFLGSMSAAFAGAASMQVGYLGLILGAVFAGLVYVVLAIVVKCVGVNWINKLMPAVVIGPTVAIIGLSLAGNAVGDLNTAPAGGSTYLALVCGLVTLAVTVLCSVYGKKTIKMIPFVLGILAGYAVALILTIIGTVSGNDALLIINLAPFKALVADGVSVKTFINVDFFNQLTFTQALKGVKDLDGGYVVNLLFAYMPVAFVVFAEHIADHKNISSIIEKDLLQDPGLSRTLLGDGIGSMVGSLFGGCPNTTYGESVGCVAISGNASVVTILATAIMAILISFINPFVAFLSSIPNCCMGGVCIALYGFIAVSGLKMVQKVDLEDNRNLFVVSIILIAGIGGLSLSFTLPVSGGKVITITSVACALILGILTNVMLSGKKKAKDGQEAETDNKPEQK
ncbi:MAG: uracil-xanthine permease family protein [Eubacteriales bacterium]